MAQAKSLERDISAVNVVPLMMNSRVASRFVVIASLAAVYCVAGKIGLRFATIHPSATGYLGAHRHRFIRLSVLRTMGGTGNFCGCVPG